MGERRERTSLLLSLCQVEGEELENLCLAPLSGQQGSEGIGDAGSSTFQIFISGGSLGTWNFLEEFFLAV